jgi:protein N-terminal amidase
LLWIYRNVIHNSILKMRIATLQYSPAISSTPHNLTKLSALLSPLQPSAIDLLIFPELAITGYNYPSLASIEPYLEPTTSGLSTQFAIATAVRLKCHVLMGYPERTLSTRSCTLPLDSKKYNSAVFVSPTGEVLANYRKHFLYYTDDTWASAGEEGFYGAYIDSLDKRVAMGICMDLNPKEFKASWDEMEFASHCVDSRAELVLVSMAWTERELRLDDDPAAAAAADAVGGDQPRLETLGYWLARLSPLVTRSKEEEMRGREVLVVFANRSGTEGDVAYAGTSAIAGIKDGRIRIFDVLGKSTEGLLIVDTEKAPVSGLTVVERDH